MIFALLAYSIIMLIKDLHINKAIDTHKRYEWLSENVSMSQDEVLVFIGETFYDKDISIARVMKFLDFLSDIDKKIYIQDVDSLSGEILDVKNDSLYRFLANDKVKLFLRTSDLDFSTQEMASLSFPVLSRMNQEVEKYDEELLRQEIQGEMDFHKEDLIGIYISEVFDSDFDPRQKKALIDIGLDAMKRR